MDAGNIHYAVLGLVGCKERGVHGYRLKKEIEALSDDFWQLNYGRLYRLLDFLESCGELEVAARVQDGRPTKKVYKITQQGKQTLDDWLLEPVCGEGRPLRDELVLKLIFLDETNIDAFYQQIKAQRSVYLARLARLVRRRAQLRAAGLNTRVVDLVMEGADTRVAADLAWLEHLERSILRMS